MLQLRFCYKCEFGADILLSLPTRCAFECPSMPPQLPQQTHLISSQLVLFLSPDVTAGSRLGHCVTYLHVQFDASRLFLMNSQRTLVHH